MSDFKINIPETVVEAIEKKTKEMVEEILESDEFMQHILSQKDEIAELRIDLKILTAQRNELKEELIRMIDTFTLTDTSFGAGAIKKARAVLEKMKIAARESAARNDMESAVRGVGGGNGGDSVVGEGVGEELKDKKEVRR